MSKTVKYSFLFILIILVFTSFSYAAYLDVGNATPEVLILRINGTDSIRFEPFGGGKYNIEGNSFVFELIRNGQIVDTKRVQKSFIIIILTVDRNGIFRIVGAD